MARPFAYALLPLVAIAAGACYWLFQRPPETPIVGRPAPSFDLPAVSGGTQSLGRYRGRPVIVNFWATWCEPCKQEMPALQAAAGGQPDLVVLGIDNVEAPTKVRPYVEQLGVRFPILLDEDGTTVERYQVSGLPTSFFVDRSGTLRSVYRGALTAEMLRDGLASIS
jgi:cytochrome c biogenesis protein CcmG/thiol:disulfide interchange protein DsbE